MILLQTGISAFDVLYFVFSLLYPTTDRYFNDFITNRYFVILYFVSFYRPLLDSNVADF